MRRLASQTSVYKFQADTNHVLSSYQRLAKRPQQSETLISPWGNAILRAKIFSHTTGTMETYFTTTLTPLNIYVESIISGLTRAMWVHAEKHWIFVGFQLSLITIVDRLFFAELRNGMFGKNLFEVLRLHSIFYAASEWWCNLPIICHRFHEFSTFRPWSKIYRNF